MTLSQLNAFIHDDITTTSVTSSGMWLALSSDPLCYTGGGNYSSFLLKWCPDNILVHPLLKSHVQKISITVIKYSFTIQILDDVYSPCRTFKKRKLHRKWQKCDILLERIINSNKIQKSLLVRILHYAIEIILFSSKHQEVHFCELLRGSQFA